MFDRRAIMQDAWTRYWKHKALTFDREWFRAALLWAWKDAKAAAAVVAAAQSGPTNQQQSEKIMRNDPIGANGEAMPAITRRAFLRTGTAAAATVAIPAAAETFDENSAQKVARIGFELADALAEHDDGGWYAVVEPASTDRPPLFLGNRSARDRREPRMNPDEALFAMERDWKKAMGRYRVASKVHDEAERRYFAAKPWPPAEVAIPAELQDRVNDMRIAEWKVRDHPVNVALNDHLARNEGRRQAWKADLQRIENETGVRGAERRMNALLEKADRIARKITRTRALTPDGMLVKLRVNKTGAVEADDLLAAIARDLRATAVRSA
ncbi:hypothetical protein VSX64_23450 [Aurantimonas sp. C2-6-R+9]|uniref:hypothetical protein n=1 Tax=unclassified Aurantimonas TaxID=2638230 RepID=UPI002E18322D|nr:hypothetical protein [Aurantimonas sp. C2-6-R+9]